MNIYVSNIPYQTTDDELLQTFQAYGEVESARIIKDKMTGKSRGFAFVEMMNDNEARVAMDAVNEMEFNGRRLNAREARPRAEDSGFRQSSSGNGSPRRREGRPERDTMRSSY